MSDEEICEPVDDGPNNEIDVFGRKQWDKEYYDKKGAERAKLEEEGAELDEDGENVIKTIFLPRRGGGRSWMRTVRT
jgi:hypothetical protein